MNTDIGFLINPIKSALTPAASFVIKHAQRHEYVIRILKYANLEPTQLPKDFESLYVHTLAEYRKDDSIVIFFRQKKIKKAFHQAFVKEKEWDINNEEWNTLNNEAEKAKINLDEVGKFYTNFVGAARRSKDPGEIISKLPNRHKETPYPDEFKAVIEEKTKAFCGREFVFHEFESFLKKHQKGYFTVVGDAGMGKTAIAAQAVLEYKAICYFNIRAEGRNTPEKFLQSIREQLINRYQLQNAENDNLPTLLTKVNKKLGTGEHLVIVVDALDEVEQAGSANLLDLPKNLPDKIYFLLTRRHYPQNEKRLLTEGLTEQELDLTKQEYERSNHKDVKEYISSFINDRPEHRGLKEWIQKLNIEPLYFIDQVAQKSENNFMYLYYVLPGIARGDYQDLSLEVLPDGLQEYYRQHWKQMGMENSQNWENAIILCVLVEVRKPISCETIAGITGRDEGDVGELLNKWREFLRKQKQNQEDYYSIYHQSFADFLGDQRTLKQEKKNNNIDWQEVRRMISDYDEKLWAKLKSDEDEDD